MLLLYVPIHGPPARRIARLCSPAWIAASSLTAIPHAPSSQLTTAGLPWADDRQYHRALTRGDDRTRLILRLAGECGLRRGEIATIHTGRDLIEDLVGWSLIVNGKGEKQRLVPLPMGLASRLLAADRGWLFPGAVQGHISVEWVGRLASQVLEEGWTLHTLRARFATRAYQIDHDVFAVQELLGHASPETTQRYVKTDSARLRRLVDLVAG
ncbi:tyrosine-type recombinase/integrase [Leucobacter alluvii]|uniref:tyrosine-type recombinase/integrase n=1 Tax=Leucobacter alluvii TaxID=340321 RepID=UPI003D155C83